MKATRQFQAGTIFFAALACCLPARAQNPVQANEPAAQSAGTPPRYINFVHERLKPGRGAAYDGMLSSIRSGYERFDIPAYWISLRSFTGPDEALGLNFFDSFGDMEKMAGSLAAAVAAHPDLAGLQDRLLEENASSLSNVIAERVDALSSHADTIHFAKMRLLVVTVFHISPAHENDFVIGANNVAFDHEKVEGSPAWVMYAVIAGAPVPSYIMLTPLNSLKDGDAGPVQHGPVVRAAQAAQEMARPTEAIETNLYFVNPQLSHMPKDFVAVDSAFWTTKVAEPESNKKPSR